jgi:hypothetical protein
VDLLTQIRISVDVRLVLHAIDCMYVLSPGDASVGGLETVDLSHQKSDRHAYT